MPTLAHFLLAVISSAGRARFYREIVADGISGRAADNSMAMSYKRTAQHVGAIALMVALNLLAAPAFAGVHEYDGTSLGWEHGALSVRDATCRIHRLNATEGVWNGRPFSLVVGIMNPGSVHVGVHIVSRPDPQGVYDEMLVSAQVRSEAIAPKDCVSISKFRTIEGMLLDWSGGNAFRYIVLRLDSGDKATFNYSADDESRITRPQGNITLGATRVRLTYRVASDVGSNGIIPARVDKL